MRSKQERREAGWREFAQGGVASGLAIVSLVAVASTCIQIDTAPKVADYYNQYRDYRDQYERLSEWRERIEVGGFSQLMPDGLQGATAMLEERYRAAEALYEPYLDGLQQVQGEHAAASIRRQGSLSRPDWGSAPNPDVPANDPKPCFQIDAGADNGHKARTGEPNDLAAQCGAEARQALANQSVRPSRDGGGIAPNTAQASEVSRS